QFGDPIAQRVEHLLNLNSPFPGEGPGDAGDFMCYQIMGEKHIISNTAGAEADYIIASKYLRDPDFRVVEWLCKQQGQDLQKLEGSRYLTAAAMGDARGKHIIKTLNNTNIYPC
ncbi:hypothetical protein GGU11DRAFT_657455, partial [Lentinula aff. detonsa]